MGNRSPQVVRSNRHQRHDFLPDCPMLTLENNNNNNNQSKRRGEIKKKERKKKKNSTTDKNKGGVSLGFLHQ